MCRHKLDFAKHCKALFGSYCEAHKETIPLNNMDTSGTPAIVLGPIDNQQGTYKLLSLSTGKKIKRRQFTKYPIPDSVIKKVESLGHRTQQDTFDFADRNSFLFKWNDKVDEQQEDFVEEDPVPYPSLNTEFQGVTLDHDTLAIEDKIVPQGRAEDAAAQNTNLALLNIIAGVDGPAIVNTHDDIIKYNDNNDDIIAVADINQGGAPQIQPIVKINNTGNDSNTNSNANNSSNDNVNSSSNDDDDSTGDDDESIETFIINSNQGDQNNDKNNNKNKNNETTGVHRSKRKNKGKTDRFFDCSVNYGSKTTSKSGSVPSHHPRQCHVLLGHSPK